MLVATFKATPTMSSIGPIKRLFWDIWSVNTHAQLLEIACRKSLGLSLADVVSFWPVGGNAFGVDKLLC